MNSLARSKVSLDRIRESWSDMLRVAGSLHTGAVRAYDLVRMLARDGRPGRIGQAFEHYGRIAKTLHLLSVIDDETYRRRMSSQINIQEERHRLARRVFTVSVVSCASDTARARKTSWVHSAWS